MNTKIIDKNILIDMFGEGGAEEVKEYYSDITKKQSIKERKRKKVIQHDRYTKN
jgi:hypothetical protein